MSAKKGTILIQAMVMIVVVAGLASAMVVLSTNDRTASNRSIAKIGAQTAADGATQLAVETLMQNVANQDAFVPDFDGNVDIGAVTNTGTNALGNAWSIALGSYRSPRQVQAPVNDPPAAAPDTTVPWPNVRYHVRKVGSPVLITQPDGFREQTQMYHVWATVFTRSTNADPRLGETTVTVHRMVSVGSASVFQYAIFYVNDLEIVNSAALTVQGRIHANGKIYLDPNGTMTVKPNPGGTSFIHGADTIERKHPNYNQVGGTLQVQVNGSNVNWPTSLYSEQSNWSTNVRSAFTDTNQSVPDVMDGALGTTPITPPTFQSFGPSGYYDQNAGLNVKYDGTTLTVLQGTTNVTAAVQASGALSQTTFWDQRERQMVNVIDIDVSKLGGNFPSNGVIYASRTDSASGAAGGTPNAFRLKNGATLPASMTFVSNDPVYVKGDFNSSAPKSSAIIADAVTVLSNSWNDGDTKNQANRIKPTDNPQNKSGSYTISGEMPQASNTTYNFAMVSGNTISNYAAGVTDQPNPNQSGFMNGGVINLPRFLEDWSGKTMTYSGSMVNLFTSQIANSPFAANEYTYNVTGKTNPPKPVNGDVYNPPTRIWSYDTGLMTNAPPMTPQVVRIVENVFWTN